MVRLFFAFLTIYFALPNTCFGGDGKQTNHSGHAAWGHGHHAAHDSGMMVQYMMMKGIMDAQAREQVRNSFENLNQRINTLKKEAAAGNITPADYQTARQQMEQAYSGQLKGKPFQNIELSPASSLKRSEQEGMSLSNDSASKAFFPGSNDKESLSTQSASQKSDLAKLESTSQGLQSGAALPLAASGSGAVGGANSGLTSLQGSGNPAAGGSALAGMSPSIHNSINVDSSSDNHANSRNQNHSGSSPILDGGQSADGENSGEFSSQESQLSDEEAKILASSNKEELAGHYSLVSSQAASSGVINTLKDLVSPLKVQKDFLSTKVISDEGIHPLVLLLILGGVFIWGRQRSNPRIPKVIPEVVLMEEQKPFSQSKAITLRKLG